MLSCKQLTVFSDCILLLVYGTCSNQAGGWSQEGVSYDEDNSNDTRVTCLATHLTSFAVLVSIKPGTVSN